MNSKEEKDPPFGNAGRELAQMGIRHARVYRDLHLVVLRLRGSLESSRHATNTWEHAGARRESANLPR
jgi:hypothetical protein